MAEKKASSGKIKKKKTSMRYKNYQVSGTTITRKNKSCLKCGPGIFLANHKDRLYCGKCGYVEMKSK